MCDEMHKNGQMNERAGALSFILKAKWTEFFITSHFIEAGFFFTEKNIKKHRN